MNSQSQVSHQLYNVLPTDIEGFESLAELALDMRWSWTHATDALWQEIDPDLWALTNNPWLVLVTASRHKIESLLADPVFHEKLNRLVQARREAVEAPAGFSKPTPRLP